MPERPFDYIIAGAGAAGLSLLWRFLNDDRFFDKNILLIDRSLHWQQEKTWCFWDDSSIPFKHLITHSWSRIEVRSKHQLFSQNKGVYRYHCIHSKLFRQHVIELAQSSQRVKILQTEILSFGEANGYGTVETSTGIFSAEWVFQSLELQPLSSTESVPVLQHFKGHLIETQEPVFTPDTMTLMDFNVMPEARNSAAFFYVLPYSDKKALIEYTLFSEQLLTHQLYDAAITWYIGKRFGIHSSEYSVSGSEIGSIPMDDTRIQPFINRRTLSIGSCGGATKPTTGYTFTRIQHHANLIIEALADKQTPPAFPESAGRFRLYDKLLLHILRKKTMVAPQIFHALFKHNTIDNVLKFLDENSRIIDEIRIFSSLPWIPFLSALTEISSERSSR